MGDRYLDTVYNDAWVLQHFGPEALVPHAPVATAARGPKRAAAVALPGNSGDLP